MMNVDQCSRVKVALSLLNNSALSVSSSASASTRATKLADQFRDCADVALSAEATADATSTTAHANGALEPRTGRQTANVPLKLLR
jgi:vacuolar-type H+-ATPase catalytic subunit A/Vma1